MNENRNRLFSVYRPLLFLLLAVAVSFRTAALIMDFDPLSGYFNDKALISIADISAFAGSVLLLTYAPIKGSKERLIASFSTPETYIPTGIVGVALAFFSADCFIRYKDLGRTFSELMAAKNIHGMLMPILAILSLLAIGYFTLNATVERRASEARGAFGLFAVLFFALYAAYLYFDSSLPLNAPNKIIDQMAYLFSALFFLYEIRISLGREKWNLYMAFGFVSALLTATSSIPALIFYFSRGTIISNEIGENVLTLCLFIFIASRIMLASTLRPDVESDFVNMMKEASQARNAYVDEKSEILESYVNDAIMPIAYTNETVKTETTDDALADDDLIEVSETEDTKEESAEISDTDKESFEESAEISDTDENPIEETEELSDNVEEAKNANESEKTDSEVSDSTNESNDDTDSRSDSDTFEDNTTDTSEATVKEIAAE